MKTYAVNYNGGAGGHFLQELILWCETQDTLILTYPKANAHFIVDNWVTNNLDGVTALSEYHTLKSNSPYNFIITYGGTVDSVNTMYQRDLENFRMINVVIDNPFEMALCEYNHFYKNQLHEFKFNGIDYGLFPHYKNLMSRHTSNEILMPDWGKVSTEDMSEILLAQGIKMYKEGLDKRPHDWNLPKNPKMPKEMKILLEKYEILKNFRRLSPSVRKMYFRQFLRIKRPETKIKFIKKFI